MYIYQLIGDIEDSFFDDNTAINSFFDNNLFINNHDIYIILHCIYRIIGVCVVADEKRRENILGRMYLDDKNKLSIQKFYSALFDWYNKNNWYNSTNLDKLNDHEKMVFGKDPKNLSAYNKLCEDVFDGIYANELYQKIIGEMGEWGTIDNVDEVLVEDLAAVVKKDNLYSVVFYVSFGTQTYFEHEYYRDRLNSVF